jgi:hypothetical protein
MFCWWFPLFFVKTWLHIIYDGLVCSNTTKLLQEKGVKATMQKEEKRKKPKPEEHEGTPPRQHCPPEKASRR